MILFLDRSMGKGIGRTLRRIKGFPAAIETHDAHFAQDTPDDVWLAEVGRRGWIAMGQDYRHHLVDVERDAIRTHGVGVFYLWGANASQWEQLRVLAKAWDRIEAASREPAPFIHRIMRDGRLKAVAVRGR